MSTEHPQFTRLDHRAVLTVSGEDRAKFLQGLISNDIGKVTPERGMWSGFLTPQGRFLNDLFVTQAGESYLIDTDADRLDGLVKRLTMFKLRAKVEIAAAPGFGVWAVWGDGAANLFGLSTEAGASGAVGDGTALVDPRRAEAGLRLILPLDGAEAAIVARGADAAPFDKWDRQRMALGLPDGGRDMIVEHTLLLEAGFDELGGVDFNKGCYMGQELTARTKYRGLVKKRLLPVEFYGPVPAPGTPITLAGEEAGEMRSAVRGFGIALLRLDKVREAVQSEQALLAGAIKLRPQMPGWMVLPDAG